MFDVFAKLLSSVATFLFPVFASYKALKGNDPGQLAPWLMYWVVLACLLLVESWFEWILMWFPFYAWIRAAILLYLVLPQTQGARMIYQTQLDPFLTEHENEIDAFIASAHDRAKAAGVQYLRRAIELVKEHVFGIKPPRPSSTPPKSPVGSYTQNLLARFYLPTARAHAGVPTTADFYNLIASVLGKPPSSASGQEAPASGASLAALFGFNLASAEERMNYIAVQRERLRGLLQALDQEASNISTSGAPADESKVQAAQVSLPDTPREERDPTVSIRKNRSEMDFESVEREDLGEEKRAAGGWMPWNWSSSSPKGKRAAETETARSTGTDVG